MLFIGNYDINHVEKFPTPDTKMVLLIGHNYINQTGILTSSHHSPVNAQLNHELVSTRKPQPHK